MFFVMKNGGMTTSQYYKEFSSDEQVKALVNADGTPCAVKVACTV